MLIPIVLSALVMVVAMGQAWAFQRQVGNAGWSDTFWTFGTALAGLVSALVAIGGISPNPRQWIAATLITIWGLRLGLHLAARTAGAAEDSRYAALRGEWGERFQTRLFWFLQIQALAGFALSLSVLVAARNPALGWRVADGIGIAFFAVSIIGGGIADWQLSQFKSDPRNKGGICATGLWAWSRHPNYFFEWVGWIAYPLLAIDLSGSYDWGWIALSGPALIYWLLVHVSGIPLLEQQMLRTRGDAYRAHQARTRAFFPIPRRQPRAPAPTPNAS